MKKELTYQEFYEYVKKNGITCATRTEDIKIDGNLIPKEDKIYYREKNGYISSFDISTYNLNQTFGYDYDYEWRSAWEKFEGKFIIETEEDELGKDEIIIKEIELKGRTYRLVE